MLHDNCMITRTDKKILALLQKDGRASVTDIGERVGLSASACSRRLAQLQKSGAIRGFHATLAPEILDMQTMAIVQVSLSSQSETSLRAFENAIARTRAVLSCDLMSGSVDYLLRIAVKDIAAYESLHREVLAMLPGVARIESSFVLRGIVDRQQAAMAT